MRLVSLLALTSACSPYVGAGNVDVRSPDWSMALMQTSGGDVITTEPRDGEIVRVSPSGDVERLAVGGEPTRLAATHGNLLVSLRADDALAVVKQDRDGALYVDRTVPLGSEPYGMVVPSDEWRVYVALSGSDAVVALDGRTLEEVDRWSVPGSPRWLALSPDEGTLFAASAYGGTLTSIDVHDGTFTVSSLPTIPVVGASSDHDFEARITADPVVSPDGRRLAVPAIYVDTVVDGADDDRDAYASSEGSTLPRFNPVVATWSLDGGHVDDSRASPVFATGTVDGVAVGSYPTGLAFRDDSVVVVAEEASDVLVSVDLDSYTGAWAWIEDHDATAVRVGPGPSGVYAEDGSVWTRSWLDGSLWRTTGDEPADLVGSWTVQEDGEVALGRLLFHRAGDGVMSAPGSGVSCSTCHFEGRNDGLTWQRDDGARQTPSLAADVGRTAPYTWEGNVDAIGTEVEITSQDRMGGADLTDGEGAAVAAYVAGIRPPNPSPQEPDAVARGERLFSSAGCVRCHVPPTYADTSTHLVVGDLATNTPSLIGIGASAPYFHDGSAATLEAAIDAARDGRMGPAADIDKADTADLVAFLRSL